MTHRSPSGVMGTFLPVQGPADLAIPPVCGVSPVTRRTIDAAVETWSAALSGMADYWSAAIIERRTPADVALDGLRWWQLIADRRPPQWASRQRIVRRSVAAPQRALRREQERAVFVEGGSKVGSSASGWATAPVSSETAASLAPVAIPATEAAAARLAVDPRCRIACLHGNARQTCARTISSRSSSDRPASAGP
jgi:hypothetical protein